MYWSVFDRRCQIASGSKRHKPKAGIRSRRSHRSSRAVVGGLSNRRANNAGVSKHE